jgi:hypothetical protein
MGARFWRNTRPELDELFEGLLLGESFRHSAGATAAEHDDLGAEPGQPREGFLRVGHLLVSIQLRSRHFESRGKKQVGHRNGKPDLRANEEDPGIVQVAVPPVPDPQAHFVFADYLQWSWAYAIRLGTSGNPVIFVGAEGGVVANSFTEFVALYVQDAEALYPAGHPTS